MSLRFRLIALVWVVLPVSLAFGSLAAWVNASRSVHVEMRAALLVARQTIQTGVERLQTAPDVARYRDDLVASFNGNRHLRVWLVGATTASALPVAERSPLVDMPAWIVRLIGVDPTTDRVPVVVGDHAYGTIAIETDPSNEILEVWNEFVESLVTPVVFCALLILLIYIFIGRALRPIGRLAAAMEDVGEGRFRTRIDGRLTPELARLRDSFNRMAARLAETAATNRRLNEQLLTLQDQERSELARDLHDEVSPFLFTINVDAAAASRRLEEGRAAEADGHIQSIADAVRHMQRQVRRMIGGLRPIGLAEFGLREAIENLVAFWRRRWPDLHYQVEVCADCEDPGELVGTTICRVIQEALSNAVRHAEPTTITIVVDRRHDLLEDRDEIRVVVADDGRGMSEPNRLGYGLVGVHERVSAVGGRLTFSNRSGKGFAVTAFLPCVPVSDPLSPVARGDGAMKVLIIDDHPIVRAGLRRLLAVEPATEVIEAADGREALHAFREQRPTLVIVDLNLPGLGGIEVVARLKIADPEARILVLSMHDDYIHVTRALQAGAAGYVTKNAPPEELLEAVKRVAGGQTYVEHEIAEGLVFSNLRSALAAARRSLLARPRNAASPGAGSHPAANCRRARHRL